MAVINFLPTDGKPFDNNKILSTDDYTYTGSSQLVQEDDGWKLKFLTSGTFTPNKDLTIDTFLVGGGGSGCENAAKVNSTTYIFSNYGVAGAGGGGGYTKTQVAISLVANTAYPIVIGAGGAATTSSSKMGNNGGASSGFNTSAAGGQCGSQIAPNGNYSHTQGGDGGSGGGGCYMRGQTGSQTAYKQGGSDGSNAIQTSTGSNGASITMYGVGQKTTTREFKESTGELYAGGGGCGWTGLGDSSTYAISDYGYGAGGEGGGGNGATKTLEAVAGTANTGGGGGGGRAEIYFSGYNSNNVNSTHGAAGGSGIVIIRNHRE